MLAASGLYWSFVRAHRVKPTLVLSLLIVPALLSGCAGGSEPGTVIVNVIPQNHSGKQYTLDLTIKDDAGETAFEKTYTLSPTDHSGTPTKLTVATGKYTGIMVGNSGETQKTADPTITIDMDSKNVLAVIETNEELVLRVTK